MKYFAAGGDISTPMTAITPITNLLDFPDDLTNADWLVSAPNADKSVQYEVTWNVSGNNGRINDYWFTASENDMLLFVFRGNYASEADEALTYHSLLSLRYFNKADDFINEVYKETNNAIRSTIKAESGIYRNYCNLFTAAQDGANVMFDIYDHPHNSDGLVFNYEAFGLYIITGLTGWVQDANFPQIRFNLDKRITWWGDSISDKQVYYLKDWLNVVHAHDEAVGGETSAEILARLVVGGEKLDHPTIIMAGHNTIATDDASATQIKSDIAAMTAILDDHGTDYRVCTLVANKSWTNPSAGYTTLTAANAWINSTYGTKAVDVYAYLRTKGDGGVDDNADIASGIMPRSLNLDAIHLNGRGTDFMRDIIFASVDTKGWHG